MIAPEPSRRCHPPAARGIDRCTFRAGQGNRSGTLGHGPVNLGQGRIPWLRTSPRGGRGSHTQTCCIQNPPSLPNAIRPYDCADTLRTARLLVRTDDVVWVRAKPFGHIDIWRRVLEHAVSVRFPSWLGLFVRRAWIDGPRGAASASERRYVVSSRRCQTRWVIDPGPDPRSNGGCRCVEQTGPDDRHR